MEAASQFAIQLYHHAAITVPDFHSLRGLKVLDIGCGKGGGLAFLTDFFQPATILGVDSSTQKIAFAKQAWPKTKFAAISADAIARQIVSKFDLILCVESWAAIADKISLLEQVKLLLHKPVLNESLSDSRDEQYAPSSDLSVGMESQIGLGFKSSVQSQAQCAKFVIADKFSGSVDRTEADFKKHFDIESRTEITLNVKHASKLDRKRKAEQLRKFLSGRCNQRILDFFENLVEEVQKKDDERDTTKYYVYVLVHKK